jgi:hypothetical protein
MPTTHSTYYEKQKPDVNCEMCWAWRDAFHEINGIVVLLLIYLTTQYDRQAYALCGPKT